MFRNYFKTAWRNIVRNRFYSAINVLGLAIGLTAFIFIALFVREELSYDRYHDKADRIYRLWQTIELEGTGERSSSVQFPVAPNLQRDYSHIVEESVRFFDTQQEEHLLTFEDRRYNVPDLFFVDTNVFKVFDWNLIEGDIENALMQPNSIVITADLSKMLFGDDDPIGKQLTMESGLPLMVTGILESIPDQSHLHINALVSFSTLQAFMGNPVQAGNWVWNPCWTYLLIKEGASVEELIDQFPYFVEKYYPEFMAKQVEFYMMPLTDIHLKSHLEYEIEPNGNADSVWILGLIGLFVLLIAAINFINLATARSAHRAKEVGIRKVLGGSRSMLVFQFLGESLILAFLALVVSIVAIVLLTPMFNNLADRSFAYGTLFQGDVFLMVLVVTVVTGLLSGLYPAFYLSSFEPVKSLKSGYSGARGSMWFRRALVVLQFSLAIGLLAGTWAVGNQFNYMLERDTGFDQAGVVIVKNKPAIVQQFDAFRDRLMSKSNVLQVTRMNEIIGVDHNVHEYRYDGMPNDEWKYFPSLIVDEYFTDCFALEMVAGRAFNPEIKSDDTAAVIINETMALKMGWQPEEAVGKRFITPHGNEHIIGVMKDFHFVNFTEEIQPFVLDMQKNATFGNFFNKYTAIRVSGNEISETISHLESTWNQFAPAFPFEYFFLDNRMQQQYRAQEVLKDLVSIFSVLAILITCIGLFALSSFTVERRTKEVGIRKILGAPNSALAGFLFRDQIMLLGISLLVSGPLTFYLLNIWLTSFAYHIAISPILFFGAALVILAISLITVSYHAIRITRTDPVKALRYV